MELFYISYIRFHEKKIHPKKRLNYYTYDFQPQVGKERETIVVPRLRKGKNVLQRETWGLICIASHEFEKKTGFTTLNEFVRNRDYTVKNVV